VPIASVQNSGRAEVFAAKAARPAPHVPRCPAGKIAAETPPPRPPSLHLCPHAGPQRGSSRGFLIPRPGLDQPFGRRQTSHNKLKILDQA
jgi:hypothetical protein